MAGSARDWLVWYESLYRYARALSHDPALAEELVQETYKRALAAKRIPDGGSPEDVRRWLFTITRHIWQNELRQRTQEIRGDREWFEEHMHSPPSPEVLLSRKLLQSEIQQAVDSLPEPFREVLLLRELESLSYAQIASILDCPPGTVMSRLARARAMLRVVLRGACARRKERST
jgi:RNA polymerase sigma-70 factor, ECF subfamily